MTGYESKKVAARDKLKCKCSLSTSLTGDGCQYCNPEYMDDDALTIAYQSGFYDGKKAAAQEQKPMHPQLKAMLEEYFDKCFAESSTQRPWVGLTAEEAAECWTTSATQTWKNIENALRNKNT